MTTFIQQANPGAAYLEQKEAIDAAIARVLSSGWYVLGEEVQAFETEFASFAEADNAISVASGTDAIELALRAAGVGRGDLVFTVSHTAVATVAAIERAGATPYLVDVVPDTYTMDPVDLAAAVDDAAFRAPTLTPKVVIPVHLNGHPADMHPILEIARAKQLLVIEDCAQAHGARYSGRSVGTLGDLGTFSFYPTKNLGAIGDGGMVVCRNPEIADRLRSLREYGWEKRYVSAAAGINSRLDELQAAILRVKLKKLALHTERRRSLANRYRTQLQIAGLPVERKEAEHVYHLFVIRVEARDALQISLREEGIGTAVHYPVPIHRQDAYSECLVSQRSRLEVTEAICGSILSLPLYPQLEDSDVDRICERLNSLVKG